MLSLCILGITEFSGAYKVIITTQESSNIRNNKMIVGCHELLSAMISEQTARYQKHQYIKLPRSQNYETTGVPTWDYTHDQKPQES